MRCLASFAARALLAFMLLVPAGCSLSTSSESSSDSSKSSESSSRSSTSDDRKAGYREDVRSYIASALPVRGPLDVFEKTLGELARRYGVTNWEDDEVTYVGIGEGLGEAGVEERELATYAAHFSRSDPRKRQAIQRGYDTRP
jgi:hypothetical protein